MNSNNFRTARGRSIRKLGAGVLLMGLAITASARDESVSEKSEGSTVKGQMPRQVVGKSGHKQRHWLQIGVASWYGSHFQGRTTAAGESFDMNQMTCAHPTLPMGTWLRVTNLRNRRTTFVRVNDRGPVTEGRIVDLSFAAARVLGLAGVGKVQLETVRRNDPDLDEALVAQVHIPLLFSNLVP